MSNDLNLCQFIGRLGRDPDMRFTPDGKAVANFSIACGQTWKDKNGEKQEKTEWVRLVAFGKLAEIIGQYLTKGSQVYVSGRIQTREYEKDGTKRYTTEVVLDAMQMLGSRAGSKPEAEQEAKPSAGGAPDFDDLDIPF